MRTCAKGPERALLFPLRKCGISVIRWNQGAPTISKREHLVQQAATEDDVFPKTKRHVETITMDVSERGGNGTDGNPCV